MESKFKWKDTLSLLKESYKEWNGDDPFGKAAAVSYYAVFSLPGLLLITVTIIGLFLDDEAATKEITSNFESILGGESAANLARILININLQDKSMLMTIVGIGSLLFGASGLFFQLQKTLNDIWEVQKNKNAGIKTLIKDRATSLGIVVSIGFLLLLSLILSAVISALSDFLTTNFSDVFVIFSHVANFLLSVFIISLLFAAIFKVLPDVEIKWKMVWLGAGITSLLFNIGKTLIAFYLSKADPGATFGAAGSIILFLLWISYSCLILFFGAEFTQVFGRRYGYKIKPSAHAEYTAEHNQKMREREERGNDVKSS